MDTIVQYQLLGWILLPPLIGSLLNGILHLLYVNKEKKPKTISSLIAIFSYLCFNSYCLAGTIKISPRNYL